MFDELSKYKDQGSFFYGSTDSLAEVCNAPDNKYGVFLVYALLNGRVELVYIGKSGCVPSIDAAGVNEKKVLTPGLKAQLVNGNEKEEGVHQNIWPVQMMIENIDALHIHWYVTMDDVYHDTPKYMMGTLLQKYQSIYRAMPRWNRIAE